MASEAKIIFTPCCTDGEVLEFNGQGVEGVPSDWWAGGNQGDVWKYTPLDTTSPLEGCYIITSQTVPFGGAPVTLAPPNTEMMYLAEDCTAAAVLDPSCNCEITILVPCCDGDKELYFQATKRVFNDAEAYTYKDRNYTVIKSAPLPQAEVPDPFPGDSEVVATDEPCDDSECCSCIRVRSKNLIVAPISVVVVNCDGVNEGLTILTNRAWSEKICARSWDLNADSFEVEVFGDCVDQVCPTNTCFLLEDCEGIEEDIYVSYNSIESYIGEAGVIKIDGFPNTCWSFREISECECVVEITVLSSWVDCEECRKCKGYKLTNCEDSTYIKYTTNDLSEYIGQTVEFEDCPGCWFVECLEIEPPSDQNLIVEYSFKNCEVCLSKFWKLTPCPGQEHDPIYTDTDLVAYEGFIVTLDNIPGICFELEEVRDLEGNDFETIFINEYYVDCDTCKADISDCLCSTAVNGGSISESLTYLDCNGVWIETAILPSGTRSPRVCAIEWDLKNAIDIEWYGECTEEEIENEDSIWECPKIISRIRSVRPGYDTPGCPADYFDKISCKFGEALYKDVLVDRYGITTNCSSEEFDKWDIKKELLNMAAITNPDYDCPPIPTGCYDPCSPVAAFANCLTGDCFGYTITYEANAPDDTTTYTDCETCDVVNIEHVETDTIIVYTICVTPGTPIITEGFLELLGECPEPLIPCSCSTYTGAVNSGAPGVILYLDCNGVQAEHAYPGTTGEWDAFTFCGQPGQTNLQSSGDKGFHYLETLCCGNAPICISSTLTFPADLIAGAYSWLDCSGVAQVVSYPFVTTEYSVDVCAQQGTLFTDGPIVVEGSECVDPPPCVESNYRLTYEELCDPTLWEITIPGCAGSSPCGSYTWNPCTGPGIFVSVPGGGESVSPDTVVEVCSPTEPFVVNGTVINLGHSCGDDTQRSFTTTDCEGITTAQEVQTIGGVFEVCSVEPPVISGLPPASIDVIGDCAPLCTESYYEITIPTGQFSVISWTNCEGIIGQQIVPNGGVFYKCADSNITPTGGVVVNLGPCP